MATQSAKINTRLEPELKEQVEVILDELGLTTAEAIRLYFKQIVHRGGIPFAVRMPTAATLASMEEARNEESLITYATPEKHFKGAGI